VPRRVVQVAVDVPALADQGRVFDYLVADNLTGDVAVGTLVRVPLHGRRVGGWVVADNVAAAAGMRLQRVAKVTGLGPSRELVELSSWAAWRWSGRRTALLRAASPPAAVRGLPPPGRGGGRPAATAGPVDRSAGQPRPGTAGGPAVGREAEPAIDADVLAREARAAGEAVVRLPPAADVFGFVLSLLAAGPALVVVPSTIGAQRLAHRLGAAGVATALVPDRWAQAAAGGVTVVGARAAAWAPAPGVATMVVLDAHDETLVEERAPCWSAWVVTAERARRAGVPCVLVSPTPTLEQLQWGRLILPVRAEERRGWAAIEVIDRKGDDPRTGLFGERVTAAVRAATPSRRVAVVLGRTGRSRLLACRSCGSLVTCERCGAAVEGLADPVEQTVGGAGTVVDGTRSSTRRPTVSRLHCRRCLSERAAACQACGRTALRTVRVGVSRLRDDLAALTGLAVGEVTAGAATSAEAPLVVGTEAVLHLLGDEGPGSARGPLAAVVFVDFDAELSAPRYRAGERSLGLLARASRLVGGRGGGAGRVLVQTRQPDHPALQAAVRADPGRLVDVEAPLRQALGLPPARALAELSGDEAVAAGLARQLGTRPGIEVLGPTRGRWLVRAADDTVLCDALAAAGRPAGADGATLRIEVDPLGA